MKKYVTKEEYDKYVKKLESEISDSELKNIGNAYVTKRVDRRENVCRVVPQGLALYPEILTMPKDTKIIPEDAVEKVYKEMLQKLTKKREK